MGEIFMFDDKFGLLDCDGNRIDNEKWLAVKGVMEHSDYIERHNKKGASVKGYVYMLKDVNNLTKIGCTIDLERRKRQLEKDHSKLQIARVFTSDNIYLTEKVIHLFFKEHRVTGEWYALDEQLINSYKIGILDADCNVREVFVNE